MLHRTIIVKRILNSRDIMTVKSVFFNGERGKL